MITEKIQDYLAKETDIIITTGGMSVDPDDVTKEGIQAAGFDQVHYSSAVLPGAMFLLGYKGETAIMGLPACGLYHRTTIFDLIFPRLMAGETPGARDLASLGHGGLLPELQGLPLSPVPIWKICLIRRIFKGAQP